MSDVRNESVKELGKRFELSLISVMTPEQLKLTIKKAIDYNLAAILVPTFMITGMKEAVKGTDLRVGGAVSFPLGSEDPEVKAYQAELMVKHGVDDIDFVMNFAALAMGHPEIVDQECRLIRKAAPNAIIKMILEVSYLNDDQIRQAVKIAAENRIDYAKSSTGQAEGPTMEQVCILVDEAKKGGIKSKVAGVKYPRPQNAMAFLCAGVDRIGTQRPFEILDGIQLLKDRGIF
jgi:deoxyribose-phosphate aldolase